MADKYYRPATEGKNSSVDGTNPTNGTEIEASNAGFGVLQMVKGLPVYEVLDALPLSITNVQNSTDFTAADSISDDGVSEVRTIAVSGTVNTGITLDIVLPLVDGSTVSLTSGVGNGATLNAAFHIETTVKADPNFTASRDILDVTITWAATGEVLDTSKIIITQSDGNDTLIFDEVTTIQGIDSASNYSNNKKGIFKSVTDV